MDAISTISGMYLSDSHRSPLNMDYKLLGIKNSHNFSKKLMSLSVLFNSHQFIFHLSVLKNIDKNGHSVIPCPVKLEQEIFFKKRGLR